MRLCSDGWAAQSDVQFDTSGLLSLLKAESFSVLTRLTQALTSMNCNTMTSLTASYGQVFNLKPSVPVSGSSVILGNKKTQIYLYVFTLFMYFKQAVSTRGVQATELQTSSRRRTTAGAHLPGLCHTDSRSVWGSADHQTPTILLQSDRCRSRFYNKHTRQAKVDTIECSGLITICTVTYIAKSHICSLNYINYSGLHNYQAVSKLSYDIFSISLTCSQGRRWSGTTVGCFDPCWPPAWVSLGKMLKLITVWMLDRKHFNEREKSVSFLLLCCLFLCQVYISDEDSGSSLLWLVPMQVFCIN